MILRIIPESGYNVSMKKRENPYDIRIEKEELDKYRALAEKCGMPLATFLKVVLRLYADTVANKLTDIEK